MDDVALLIALRGETEEYVLGAVEPRRDLVVTRRCVDTAEVLAAGLAGLGALAVIGDEFDPDRALVARLEQAGVRTAIVTTPTHAGEVEAIGAHPLVGRGADLVAGIEALAALVRAGTGAEPQVAGVAGEPAAASDAQGQADEHGTANGDPGRMIAVTGPHGAPGRTAVTINLAAELVVDGGDVVIVDADVWGASVAPAFALTDTTAGLAAAVRAASRGTLDVTSFERLCLPITRGLRVLAGVSRAARWREISTPAVADVWEVARRAASTTIVEAPVLVPEEETDAFDQLGPARNAVADSVLTAADVVVVVGAAEPIGIERLVAHLLDLRERHPRLEPIVVVNRLRASAAGTRPEESVREALARFAGVDDPVLVADDRPAYDRALLGGGVLAETAPRSPARRGLRELARRVSPPPAPSGQHAGGRRERRTPRRSLLAAVRRSARMMPD